MLSQIQLKEIRESLENSQNPLFFFDNDVDGLCSFLIMQRFLGRGRGISIKSFPELDRSYYKKVEELNADTVFILDKPLVDILFLKDLEERNIPVVWIDHHEMESIEFPTNVRYYNSFPSAEPVTYLSYQVTKKKEDLFLAMIGCIGDVYLPDFAKEFTEKNPDLFNLNIPVFDSLFLTEIGKAVRLLNFALKDTVTNVVNMIRYLSQITNIYEILQESNKSKTFHLRAKQLEKIHNKLVQKAENNLTEEKLFVFTYSGDTAMSADLANWLYFKHKDKMVIVAFRKQDKLSVSLRGKEAKKILFKITKKIPEISGGGHDEACGAQVPTDLFEKFINFFRNELG